MNYIYTLLRTCVLYVALCLLFITQTACSDVRAAHADNKGFLADKQVQDFIARMVKQHGFDTLYLEALFTRAEKRDDVLERIKTPAESGNIPWQQYHDIFIGKERIQKGKEALRTYKKELAYLEKKYGVPQEVIVAVVGVETLYGKYTGSFRVFDSLATIAFHYPRRHKFFASELEHFLLFCRKYELQPLSLLGSYAGAMGLPQFMPSSYLQYAKSYKGEAMPDIWDSMEDAFTSVAYYLHRFGWQRNQPVLLPVRLSKSALRGVKKHSNHIKATVSYKKARMQGWTLLSAKPSSVSANTLVSPITLEQLGGTSGARNRSAWLGFYNLYVISRYNSSLYYALVVSLLAERIAH